MKRLTIKVAIIETVNTVGKEGRPDGGWNDTRWTEELNCRLAPIVVCLTNSCGMGEEVLAAPDWRRGRLHEQRTSGKRLDGFLVDVHRRHPLVLRLTPIRPTIGTEDYGTQIERAHFTPPSELPGSNNNLLCARKSDSQHRRDKLRHDFSVR